MKHSAQDVIVSISDDHMEKIDEVVGRLRRAGLKVKDVLQETGTVTGSAPAAKIGALASLSGVAAVEKAQTYQLPPPESEIQ